MFLYHFDNEEFKEKRLTWMALKKTDTATANPTPAPPPQQPPVEAQENTSRGVDADTANGAVDDVDFTIRGEGLADLAFSIVDTDTKLREAELIGHIARIPALEQVRTGLAVATQTFGKELEAWEDKYFPDDGNKIFAIKRNGALKDIVLEGDTATAINKNKDAIHQALKRKLPKNFDATDPETLGRIMIAMFDTTGWPNEAAAALENIFAKNWKSLGAIAKQSRGIVENTLREAQLTEPEKALSTKLQGASDKGGEDAVKAMVASFSEGEKTLFASLQEKLKSIGESSDAAADATDTFGIEEFIAKLVKWITTAFSGLEKGLAKITGDDGEKKDDKTTTPETVVAAGQEDEAGSPPEDTEQASLAALITHSPFAAGQGYITSPYGERNTKIEGASTSHQGIDIGTKGDNKTLYAIAKGEVLEVGNDNGLGNYVKVKMGNGFVYTYGHLQESAVNKGATIEAGANVGTMGKTGIASGPHLHLTIQKPDNTYIDPQNLLKAEWFKEKSGDSSDQANS